MASTIQKIGAWFGGLIPRHPDAKRTVFDGLENSYLGFGTSRDKLAAGSFVLGGMLTDRELHALYYGDDTAAKVVNLKPATMMRRGYKLTSKKNPKRAEELQKLGEDPSGLDLNTKFVRGMQWGRLYGGSLIVLGALDGADNLAAPLNEKATREVRYVNVVDRRYAGVRSWQNNPFKPGYGEPETYSVGSVNAAQTVVHASRVIRFDGVAETDNVTRRDLGGWTHSTLQRPYDVVRDFAMTFKAMAHLVSDASQGVWKIDGLIDLLASNREELETRLAWSDMNRSVNRAIMLDKDGEEFERTTTNFAGLKDVAEVFMMRLSSATDYPVTLLMGRSPAGMNATGDSDFRAWYDTLATEQKTDLKPKLLRAYRMLAGGDVPDDLEVEFAPLWEPTEQEKAQTANVRATTHKLYYDMGLPFEAIAIAEFGSGNGKIEIDEAAYRTALDAEVELLKDPQARAEREAEAQALAAAKDPSKGPTDPDAPDAKAGEDEGD